MMCPSTASSELIRREALAYQNWSGAAIYADSTFSHCVLSFEHPGGIYLGLVLANSQYSLRMWNKGWNLAAQFFLSSDTVDRQFLESGISRTRNRYRAKCFDGRLDPAGRG